MTPNDLPPFVYRKSAKGKTYYYFALTGGRHNSGAKLVRLPDITDPQFAQRVSEFYQHRPAPASRGKVRVSEQRVYFIGGSEGPIKIGMSRDPEARCREMNVGAPTDYLVLATVEGGVPLERAYHLRFEYRRLRGEWFERCPEIIAEIDRLNKTRK